MDIDNDNPEERAKRRLARLMLKPPPLSIQLMIAEQLVAGIEDKLSVIKEQTTAIRASKDRRPIDQVIMRDICEALEKSIKMLDTTMGQEIDGKPLSPSQ